MSNEKANREKWEKDLAAAKAESGEAAVQTEARSGTDGEPPSRFAHQHRLGSHRSLHGHGTAATQHQSQGAPVAFNTDDHAQDLKAKVHDDAIEAVQDIETTAASQSEKGKRNKR